jgi:hypothetical protein
MISLVHLTVVIPSPESICAAIDEAEAAVYLESGWCSILIKHLAFKVGAK